MSPTSPTVTLRPVPSRGSDARTQFTELVVAASSDPAFTNTSVPAATNTTDIERWLQTHPEWNIHLIIVDGAVAGYLAVHPPDFTENSEPFRHHLETETYLLPHQRGQGVANRAWTHFTSQLPDGTPLVAEIWAHNRPAQQRLENQGWRQVGAYWWQHPTRPHINGQCIRFETITHRPLTDDPGQRAPEHPN